MAKKSLTDILCEGERDSLSRAWGETEAADEFAALPAGEYLATIVGGELFTSKTKNTPGFKLTFRIADGVYEGRQFWHDVWLTVAALALAKRDLAKLGINSLDQLEQPIPRGIRCLVKLVTRRDDDGKEFNRVKTFEVLSIDPPELDPFAPDDPSLDDNADADGEGVEDDIIRDI